MMQITELVKEKGYEVIILNPNANYWYNNRAWVRLGCVSGIIIILTMYVLQIGKT